MVTGEAGANALSLAVFWVVFVTGIFLDARRRDITRPIVQAVLFGAFGPAGAIDYWIRQDRL